MATNRSSPARARRRFAPARSRRVTGGGVGAGENNGLPPYPLPPLVLLDQRNRRARDRERDGERANAAVHVPACARIARCCQRRTGGAGRAPRRAAADRRRA